MNNHNLHELLLHYSEDFRRYQHHIAFITVYFNLNEIQKGFTIKFHNSIPSGNYKQILKICSLKLMACTVDIYKKRVLLALYKKLSLTKFIQQFK